MSKVIMFGGGSGDQTGTAVPGVCTEDCWATNNVSDLMGANGEALIDGNYTLVPLSDPSNPKWEQPVRLRLQEINDYKQKVKEIVSKNGRHFGSDEVIEPICQRILTELELN